MNFEEARKKHAEWRVRFRGSITKQEQLDAEVIALDDRCDLGKWLHGEARAKYGHMSSYGTCLQKHADFHQEAAKVARAINAGRYAEAQSMLSVGTGFSAASGAIHQALDGLERESGG